MYYDTLTMAAIRDECSERILGGRVQRVVFPSELSLALEVYTGERHQLLVSAEAQEARLLLTGPKPRRGVEAPSPLELLLRKFVRGARLEDIEQPPLERILRLTFLGEEGRVTLVCETMGRYSNVILLDSQGTIMEAMKLIPATLNRYRTILPKHEYVPPPPQDKENPRLLTPGILQQALERSQERLLWRRLVQTVAGVSPIVAREIAHRAAGRADAPAESILGPEGGAREGVAALVRVIQGLFRLGEEGGWEPCVAYAEAEGGAPVAYAPYTLQHYARSEPVASMSEAIETILAARAELDPYEQVRDRLQAMIADRIGRLQGRLASLREGLVPPEELERLQAYGNAILAVAWQIAPGQEEVRVDPELLGGDAGDPPVVIPLDPRLSPAENAQAYFARYRKRQAAGEEVPALVRRAEMEIEYLRQLQTDVDLAPDRPALDRIEQELTEAGGGSSKGRKRATPRTEPLSVRAPDGTLILVGRNSRENDRVTFRMASPGDLWLHAHGVAGAHVIVRTAEGPPSEETLRLAAALAARYSAARSEPRVQVDYTERRHVRPIRGAGPGMVTYREEQTLVVSPHKAGDEE